MQISTASDVRTDRRERLLHYGLRAAVVLAAVLVVAGALLVGFRVARSGVLPGVQVADIAVGGMSQERLTTALRGHEQRRSGTEVRVHRDVPDTHAHKAEPVTLTTTGAELGYRMDVDATAETVWHRGRQGNPFAALADHIRAFWATTEVEPVESIDTTALDAWVADAARKLELEPVEANLEFDGAAVVAVEPAAGLRVPEDSLREGVLGVLLAGRDPDVAATTEAVDPLTTTADVEALLAQARQALSAPVRLYRNDGEVTFAPEDIGAVLSVSRDISDDDVTLRLVADPEGVTARIPDDQLAAFRSEPRDARFEVAGGTVQIIDGQEGFRYDAQAAADQLVEVATGDGPREAELAGDVTEPDLTTEQARELGITEQISTFTTSFQAGQSRVLNIHRIADIVDGAVVKPGETFSLNGFVGPRTREKGFVEGGAIFDGEFISAVGGGVSQFGTTFFNAAFFGGYEFLEYKAHSYYISRYPVGREATIDYPSVDLKIRNNSPHGLLIKTSHTASSVTVTFYATKWVDVDSITGEQHNFREPQTQVRENPALPPGSERVVQSGRSGFDIVVTRVLRFPDGREERERFFTRYLAEPRIIERNSQQASPPPEDDPNGEQPPPPDQDEGDDDPPPPEDET
jgi:vancomycin resistance protein YoaR